MLNFNTSEDQIIEYKSQKKIYIFNTNDENSDKITIESFGEEWSKFSSFNSDEITNIGNEYFDIVDFKDFDSDAKVLDLGCGTGRWSIYLASKFNEVYSLDPSDAIFSAAELTSEFKNIYLIKASSENIPFDDNTFDFAISLGVLHHIPDTEQALNTLVRKIKKGGKCLIYLYYSLDNRGFMYKLVFKFSNIFRFVISKLPARVKSIVCDIIAFTVYIPLIGISKSTSMFISKNLGSKLPLSYYSDKSLNVIRNDSLDRFGTPLEQRFSKLKIKEMMEKSGLYNITFSENKPYWHAIGQKK